MSLLETLGTYMHMHMCMHMHMRMCMHMYCDRNT